jgi:hypothetical protein
MNGRWPRSSSRSWPRGAVLAVTLVSRYAACMQLSCFASVQPPGRRPGLLEDGV